MRFLLDIYNLFFPKICLSCTSVLTDNENLICTYCNHNLPLTDYTSLENNPLQASFSGRILLEQATSLLFYHKIGIVQKLIHQLKYKGHQEVGTFLGNWLGNEMKINNRFNAIDYIIPVPLHHKRFKERGYNQLDYFGQSLSEKLQVPFEVNLLQKVTNTKKQSKKNRFARMHKVDTIFKLNANKDFSGKHILLIDDIITTGATIESCYDCLSKIKDVKISIAVMAYTK